MNEVDLDSLPDITEDSELDLDSLPEIADESGPSAEPAAPAPAAITPSEAPAPTDAEAAEFARGTADFVDGMDDPGRFRPDAAREPNAAPSGLMEKYAEGASSYRPGTIVSEFGEDAKRRAAEERSGLDEFREAAAAGAKDAAGTIAKGVMNIPSHLNRLYAAVVLDPIDRIAGTQWGAQARANSAEWEAGTDSLIDTNNVVRRSPGGELALEEAAQGSPERLEAIRENDWGLRWGEKAAGLSSMMFNFTLAGGAAGAAGTPVLVGADSAAARDQMFSVAKSNGMSDGDARDYANLAFTVNTIFEGLLCGGGLKPIMNASEKLATGYVLDTSKASFSRIVNGATLGAMRNFLARTAGHSVSTGALLAGQGAANEAIRQKASAEEFDVDKILKAGEDGGIEGLWMGLGFSAAGGITAAKAYRSARRQVASEYANNVMMQTEIPSGRSVLAEINPEGMRDFVKAREDGRVPTAKETDAAGLPPMSEAERSAAADRFIGDGYTSERLAELSEMKSAEIRSAEEAASARPASEPANGFPLPPEDGGFAPTEEQARFAREANLQKGESIVGTEVADGRIAYTTSNGLVVDVAPDGTFETYPAERRADILKARESQARSEASAREARPEEAVKKESGTEAPAPAVEAEGKSAEVKDAAASEAKAPSDPLDAYYAWIEGLGISDSPASMKRFRRETGTRFPSRNPFASKLSDGTAVKAVKVGDKWNVTGKDIAATGATHEEAVANAEKLVAKKADHSVGTEKEPPIEKGADAASESASADVSAKPSDVVGGAENPAAEKTKNGAYPTKVTLSTGEATVSKVGKKWYVSGNDGVKEDAEIGEGRTRKEAIAMAEDVIARSRKAAEDMAARAGVRKNPVSPELDKNVEVRDTSVGNVTPSDEPADKKLVSDNTYPKPEKPKADVNTGAGANASNNEDIDLIDMLNHPEKMEPTPEEAEKFESERKDYREKYVAEQNEKFVEWKDGILKNAFGSDNDYIGIVRGSKSIADYVSKVRSRVSELRSKADDWASRKYKQTGKNIEFDATRDADDVADGRRIRKNATDINEARRANIVEKLRHNADELENGMREDLRKFGLDESYFNNESSEIKHNEPAVKDVSSGNVEQKSEAVAANPKAEAKGPVVKETTSVEQEVLSNAEVGKSPLFDAVSRVADAIDGRDAEGGRAAMDGVRKAIASGEKFPSKEEVDGIASRIVDEGMRRAFVENMDKWREHASASGKTADAAKQPEGPKLDIDEEARGRANGNSHFDAGDVIVRDAGRTYETGMSELADADGWTPGMKEQAAKERAAWKALCEDAANTALRDRARYVPASVAGPAKHDSRRMGAAADAAVSRAAEFAEKQARFLENAKRRIADLKPDEEKIAEYRDGRNEDPIQSDDPLAVEKLDARVSCLEERHENGKAMNAWFRRNGTMAGFPGIDPDVAKRMDEHVKADPLHYTPYPKYAASSATANIRRLKERRAEAARLRASAKDGPRTEEHEWGAVVENAADGRIQVSFGEKPSKETAQKLRRSGFKWSPSSGVWQRTLTENARRDAKSLASELDADYGVAPAAEPAPARADEAVRSRGLKSTVHDIMGDILRDAGLADEAPAPEAEAVPAEAPVQAEPAAKSEPQRPNADVIAAMNRRNREAGMRPDQLKAEIERKRNDQSIPQRARDAIVKDLQTLLDYKTKTGSAENPEERPAGFRAMKTGRSAVTPEHDARQRDLEARYKAGDKSAYDEARKEVDAIAEHEGYDASKKLFHAGTLGTKTGDGSSSYVFSDSPEGFHVGTLKAAGERFSDVTSLNGDFDFSSRKTDDGRYVGVYKVGEEECGVTDKSYDTPEDAEWNASIMLHDMLQSPESAKKAVGTGGLMKLHEMYVRNGVRFKKMADIIGRNESSWEDSIRKAKAEGYDGIEYVNDGEDRGSTSYVLWNKSDVKSAEPFTYDDSGRLIPWSERFNESSPDIRYRRSQTDRLSDPEFVAECEERGIKPTEANRRMLDLEKAKRIQKKLANFIPDVKVDVVDALPEETNHLHDGDGMTVGAFDRSTGRIYLLPGADAETVGHELLGHAMRMYAEQLARKGDGALLGRLNEVAASAPKEVWDHLRENYGIESGEELLDELFSTRLGRETRAKLEAALKTDAARKWYVRVWDAVKDLWRSFAAKFGGNRIDLSAVDDMTPDETVDFIVDQALRGRTLGTLDMEGGESGVREMRPRFTKPVPGSLMDMRGKWRDAGDTYMREMADRHHDLLSFERDLEKATGVRLDKKDSIYYQMRLLPGKNEYARVVLEATMNRYLDFLKRNGDRVTKEDVAKFVYGTFAPERNARLKAKLNVDDGSGVSDAEAAAWLDDLRARGIYDLCREGADIVRRGYEQFGLDNLLDAGMTDQATVDRMRREEPNYVPLRTDVTTEDGLDLNSVRSSEMPTFRTATGRSEEADDPLAFMLIQAMDNAVRANVNRAVRRLADIVRRNPTLGIGKVRGPKVVGTDADGNPVFDDRYNERDNPFLVAFRENGKKKYVELDGTRRGLLLAEAVRGTGPDGKSVVANLPGWYLKRFQEWMSLATRRSLGFLSRNLPKDTVEVGADLMATSGLRPGLGFAKDQLADMAKTAFGAVPVAGRLTRNDTVHRALGNFLEKGDISGPYANELKEFVESGALIGGASREGYADLEERMDAVQGRVGRRFGAVGRPIGAVGRAIRSTFGWIDLQNEIAENVSRFNNFRRRRKNGESVEDAAIASREGSTDFNMFGRQRWLNGIRAFANSILGGTMRATRSALFGRYGRRLSASMFAEGMLEALLDHLMNAGYDEEAEREGRPSGRDVPEYERSQTIRLRSGDRYVRIPMHVGPWSALKYTGDCVARYMLGELGGWKATKNIINEWKTVGVHFGGAGDVNLKTFEDDDGPSTVNSAAPTIAQLPMQLDANEDHAGRQIHKDTSGPQYEGLPKHLFARGSTSGFWTKLSRIMNRVGAGGDTEAGNPLFDSHPESYRYVAKGVFKNVGDDIVNAWDSVAAAFGDAPPDGFDWKTAPLAGTFYRNVPNNDRRYAEERVRFTRSLNQYGHDRTSDERRREIHGAMPAVEGAYDENLRKGRPYLSRLADEIAELRRMEDGFYRPHEVSADGKGTRRGAWRQREITREERAGIAAKRRALQARFILEMRRMDEAARGK